MRKRVVERGGARPLDCQDLDWDDVHRVAGLSEMCELRHTRPAG
jgi:hypothetical protein